MRPDAHDGDPVGDRERLVVVVGDEQRAHPQPDEQLPQLDHQPVAQGAVERAERLVEHQEPGRRRQGAGERHPLLLAARQVPHRPPFEPRQAHQRERIVGARGGLGPAHVVGPEPERDVPDDVAVGEERVVLEHEPDVAAVGRDAGEIDAVTQHPARSERLQPGDGPQQGALAAPARPEHAHDLAVADGQVDAVDRARAVRRAVRGCDARVGDGDALELEHQNVPTSPTRKRSMPSTDRTVRTIRIVLAAMAAPKFWAPGWPSRRKIMTGSVG